MICASEISVIMKDSAAMGMDNRFFDDFARVATGALSAFSGVREEAEARLREQFERLLARMDLVTREEFEAVQTMAVRAREAQEAMELRLQQLEAQLAATKRPAARAKPAAGATGGEAAAS
jgi:BMFP domain-containing protein YqiC